MFNFKMRKTLAILTLLGMNGLAGEKASLILNRTDFTNKSTIGELYLDENQNDQIDDGEKFLGYTLELPWRDNRTNVSCIPQGEYRVTKRPASASAKYKYDHLQVQNVLNRDAILFHVGNYPKNTTGCILVGETKQADFVGASKKAFGNLMQKLKPYQEIKLKVQSSE